MSLDTPRVAAIKIIHPTAITFRGDDAFDDNGKQITVDESAVAKKVAEIEAAQPLKDLREVRNGILSQSDWVVIKEREEGGSVSNFADWKTYRQALRDITKTYKTLDTVKWPTAPSE